LIQACFGKQFTETLGSFHALCAGGVRLGKLTFDLGEAVSAVTGQFDPQVRLSLAQLLQPYLELV